MIFRTNPTKSVYSGEWITRLNNFLNGLFTILLIPLAHKYKQVRTIIKTKLLETNLEINNLH